eukprot:3806779-Rhodomonas_salina.1
MYTDSMSAAYIVLRWTHGDYSQSLDQEDQDDVLDELLSVLRARTGPTCWCGYEHTQGTLETSWLTGKQKQVASRWS